MGGTRQVFLNSDGRGIVLLSVAVYSLLRNSDPTKRLVVYIAYGAGFRENGGCDRLSALVARFPFAEVVFLDFDPVVRRFPEMFDSKFDHWGPLLWAFPLCTELLPESVHGNLVYLDLDTLTRKDLGYLFDLPLAAHNQIAAAVNENTRAECAYLPALGWTESAGDYFNNGVMVIDIDAYRREDLARQMRDWFIENRHVVRCLDQDAQNRFLGSRTLRLPPKWNYNDSWLERSVRYGFRKTWRAHPRKDVLEAILDPAVIHYIGGCKPTKTKTHRPERHIYRAYLRELGLMKGRILEGQRLSETAKGLAFDVYHALLRLYVRILLRLVRT